MPNISCCGPHPGVEACFSWIRIWRAVRKGMSPLKTKDCDLPLLTSYKSHFTLKYHVLGKGTAFCCYTEGGHILEIAEEYWLK